MGPKLLRTPYPRERPKRPQRALSLGGPDVALKRMVEGRPLKTAHDLFRSISTVKGRREIGTKHASYVIPALSMQPGRQLAMRELARLTDTSQSRLSFAAVAE